MYEGFLIRGWEPILTGVFWLYVRSPANQRSASSGRHFTPCFAVFYHGDHRFCPQVVKVVEVSHEFGSGIETIFSPGAMGPPRRVRWDCDVVPRGTARCELARYVQASQQQVSGFDIFTPCGVVSTGEICVFVLCLMDL